MRNITDREKRYDADAAEFERLIDALPPDTRAHWDANGYSEDDLVRVWYSIWLADPQMLEDHGQDEEWATSVRLMLDDVTRVALIGRFVDGVETDGADLFDRRSNEICNLSERLLIGAELLGLDDLGIIANAIYLSVDNDRIAYGSGRRWQPAAEHLVPLLATIFVEQGQIYHLLRNGEESDETEQDADDDSDRNRERNAQIRSLIDSAVRDREPLKHVYSRLRIRHGLSERQIRRIARRRPIKPDQQDDDVS